MDGWIKWALDKKFIYLQEDEELYRNFYGILNGTFSFKGMILMKFDHYYFTSTAM